MIETYVVDTSVVIRRFVVETYTPEVRVLLSRMEQGVRLYIPEFCLIESTNVLWKNVRFRGMPQVDAAQFVVELLEIPFQIVPVSNLLPRALRLGLSDELAVYDSLYIALALELDCPLITVDQRQAEAAARSGVALKAIADFSPEE